MVSKKCVVNLHNLTLFTVVLFVNFCTNSALRTLFAEELCYGTGIGTINLSNQKSVILASVPSEELNCKIQVHTDYSSSLVVAFYRYHLYDNDSLTFTDRHHFKVALDGEGYFIDEKISLTFDTPLNIHYYTQNTRPEVKLKFQIVLTQVHDAPCGNNEYKCNNNKCIAKGLACDDHNHCGDLTFEDKCTPDGFFQEVTSVTVTRPSGILIVIGVSAAVLFILIIVLIVFVVRICVKNKKNAQSTALPTTVPTVAAAVQPPRPAQASVLNRIRQSFRGMRQPTAPPAPVDSAGQHSESCEVPSMYPKLSSDISGVDNPEFKHDS